MPTAGTCCCGARDRRFVVRAAQSKTMQSAPGRQSTRWCQPTGHWRSERKNLAPRVGFEPMHGCASQHNLSRPAKAQSRSCAPRLLIALVLATSDRRPVRLHPDPIAFGAPPLSFLVVDVSPSVPSSELCIPCRSFPCRIAACTSHVRVTQPDPSPLPLRSTAIACSRARPGRCA